jgi:hypothetical protein
VSQLPAHFPAITLPASNEANTVAAANGEPARLPPILRNQVALDAYRIVDGKYYNEFFRLSIPVPPNWTAAKLSSDEWFEEIVKFKNAMEPRHLIAMRPTDHSGWRVVPTIMVWAHELAYWPNAEKYLFEQTRLEPLLNPAAPNFRLGRMNACTIIKREARPIIYETHASGALEGYVLAFIARAGDLDTLAKMQSLFENVHVGDAVAATK